MKTLTEYIIESSLNQVDIEAIKKFLIKRAKVSSWEECVDKQEFGTCDKIVKSIWENFYEMFDCPVELIIDYSTQAQELINDNEEMNGNHFVLKKDNKYYDFARGANCINGIYVLTQNENKDKYDIILTKEEENLITDKYKRFLTSKKFFDRYRDPETHAVDWNKIYKEPWYRKFEKIKP